MIDDTTEVHTAFFALFGAAVSIVVAGKTIAVPVKYARRSADNFSEGAKEDYPVIVIQDYAPDDNHQLWSVSGEKTFGNVRDTDNDGIADTADEYGDESLLIFRYDVTQATKDFMHSQALISWFLRTFPRWGTITVNGIRYGYTRTMNDVMRSDGVFEHNHEFKIKVWFDGQAPTEVPLTQTTPVTIIPHK